MRTNLLYLIVLLILCINNIYAGPKFNGLTVDQVHGCSEANATTQPLLRLTYSAGGGGGSATIYNLDFVITGTSQLSAYKLYSTTTAAWVSPTLVGTTSSLAGNALTLTITSPFAHSSGTHYYWLVVDMAASITEGTVIDASYNHISGNYSSSFTWGGASDPTGFRIAGTHYEVGSGGTYDHYINLGQVATIIANSLFIFDNTISDIYFELVSSTVEISEINFSYNSATTAVNIRPKSGSNNLVTAPSTTTTLGSAVDFITLNGASNIHFNGSVGGTGTVMADSVWTIRNTRTSSTVGNVFTFINDASDNSIKFLTMEGEIQSNGGLVEFKTASSGGNDNNVISYSTFQDLLYGGTASFPSHGVYSSGSAGNANSGNTIDNCHFVDISTSTSATSFSVELWGNNDNWTVTNNHFFHNSTTTLPSVVYTHGFLLINSGGGYTITGNYIGGQEPSCGGGAFTISGSHQFRGIQLQAVSGSAIKVKSNTIQNIDYTTTHATTSGNAYFVAIRLAGSADITCGAVGEGNTIGSLTDIGSITCTHNNATSVGGFMGIWDGSTGTTDITYNEIGGITLPAATSDQTYNEMIHLYSNTSSSTTVDNNIIGGTVANSIDIANSTEFRAILNEKLNGATITNNTIQNIRNTGNFSNHVIYNVDGASTITGNTIKNVTISNTTSADQTHFIAHGGLPDPLAVSITEAVTISNNTIQDVNYTSTGGSQLICILVNSSSSTSNVSDNTIGSASANNMTFATANTIIGVNISGAAAATSVVSNNTIQQFNLTSTSASSKFVAVGVGNGTITASNNTFSDITTVGTGTDFIINVGVAATQAITISGNTLSNYTKSSTTTGQFVPIFVNSSGTISITNNTIGSTTANNISIGSNATSYMMYLDGGGNYTVENNTIQEIDLTSTGTTVTINGIYIESLSKFTSCSSNTITNISCAGTKSGSLIRGIYQNSAATGHLISNNVISNLHATTTAAVGPDIYGISASGNPSGANSLIEKNLIKDFTNKGTGGLPIMRGMYINGQYEVENNVILLSNGANTNDVEIGGFFDVSTAGEATAIHHNTVKIYGANTGTRTSYAYEDNLAGGGTVLKNNLFQNLRTGGSGGHYSMIVPNTGDITTDYNYLEALTIGAWGGVDKTTLANWQAVSSAANSLSGIESIENVYGVASVTFIGADAGEPAIFTGSIVVDDKLDLARDILPWMGAYEGPDVPLPLQILSFSGEQKVNSVELFWQSFAEINNDFFLVEKSIDGEYYYPFEQVKGKGTTVEKVDYLVYDNNPYNGVSYYRLKQVDFNGDNKYYGPVAVQFDKIFEKTVLYPNPYTNNGALVVTGIKELSENINVYLHSSTGSIISKISTTKMGEKVILSNLPRLESGMYLVTGYIGNQRVFNKKLTIE